MWGHMQSTTRWPIFLGFAQLSLEANASQKKGNAPTGEPSPMTNLVDDGKGVFRMSAESAFLLSCIYTLPPIGTVTDAY